MRLVRCVKCKRTIQPPKEPAIQVTLLYAGKSRGKDQVVFFHQRTSKFLESSDCAGACMLRPGVIY